jgi:hypothetical protein
VDLDFCSKKKSRLGDIDRRCQYAALKIGNISITTLFFCKKTAVRHCENSQIFQYFLAVAATGNMDGKTTPRQPCSSHNSYRTVSPVYDDSIIYILQF